MLSQSSPNASAVNAEYAADPVPTHLLPPQSAIDASNATLLFAVNVNKRSSLQRAFKY